MRALSLGLSFLTRLPWPTVHDADAATLGASVRAWPLAGVVVASAGLVGVTVGAWGVDVAVGAGLALILMVVVTGGLHLDGLSDCIDGILCNGDAQRRLTVMHDPRVGGLGAACTALWLLLKTALLLACIQRGVAGEALWCACILARGALPLEVRFGTPATPGKGLFATMKGALGTADAAVAVVLALALTAPVLRLSPEIGVALGIGSVAAAAVSFAWAAWWRVHIGGINGDVLGAAVELREATMLAAFASPLLA